MTYPRRADGKSFNTSHYHCLFIRTLFTVILANIKGAGKEREYIVTNEGLRVLNIPLFADTSDK